MSQIDNQALSLIAKAEAAVLARIDSALQVEIARQALEAAEAEHVERDEAVATSIDAVASHANGAVTRDQIESMISTRISLLGGSVAIPVPAEPPAPAAEDKARRPKPEARSSKTVQAPAIEPEQPSVVEPVADPIVEPIVDVVVEPIADPLVVLVPEAPLEADVVEPSESEPVVAQVIPPKPSEPEVVEPSVVEEPVEDDAIEEDPVVDDAPVDESEDVLEEESEDQNADDANIPSFLTAEDEPSTELWGEEEEQDQLDPMPAAPPVVATKPEAAPAAAKSPASRSTRPAPVAAAPAPVEAAPVAPVRVETPKPAPAAPAKIAVEPMPDDLPDFLTAG